MQHSTASSGDIPIQDHNSQASNTGRNRRLSSNDKPEKKLSRQGSVSENFFAVTNAALILPKQSALDEPVEGMKSMIFGGDLKTHLYAVIDVVRPHDKIKLVARLQGWDKGRMRYLVIVSTIGRQDTEESIILGIDFAKNEHTNCTIGLAIPIWSDTTITLDGDGGLKVTGRERIHTFKPISVQAMWSALQAIHRCIDIARANNYYFGSLYLTWTCYYESRVTSERHFLNEWEFLEEVDSRIRYFYADIDADRQSTELKIREELKEVMMKLDLDNCNSRDVRTALEQATDLDLKAYKEYIDTEMLIILRQMDTASQILEFLYLGSEWNAADIEELNGNGITHILNITNEIDNFFPDNFAYKNIRCYDEPTTDLLHSWNDTWKFIKNTRKAGGKCLVHCRMGISRSAATVTAFIMKENHWSMEQSLTYVKERRPIVMPNKGFMRQLQEYEGILSASNQRHNFLFRSYSESNLSMDHGNPDDESTEDVQSTPTSTSDHPQVDFNRRLLDLTLPPYSIHKPFHKRSKSWSVGDERMCESDDLPEWPGERSGINHTGPLSEPQDLSARSTYVNKPVVVEHSRSIDRKKRYRRRHTERFFTMQEFDLDVKPQSEDSVFVNPGLPKLSSMEYWLVENTSGSLIGRSRPPRSARISGGTKTNHLDAKAHSNASLPSPMNSPSYKSTKNVNVSALRSQFSDDPTLDIEISESSDVVMQSMVSLPEESSNTFPRAEVRQKTDAASYGRSLSDSQMCLVKHIVSNFELRSSGQVNTDVEQRGILSEDVEDIQHDMMRSMSESAFVDPTSSTSSNPASTAPNVAIIEKDSNQNNSNNNRLLMCDTIAADESSESVFKEESPIITSCKSSPSDCEKSRSLTQSELEVIREVGRTFLGESDVSDPELLLDISDQSESSTGDDSPRTKSSTVKKRGIVRRMAKIIENRIKKQLQGKMSDEGGTVSHHATHPLKEDTITKLDEQQAHKTVATTSGVSLDNKKASSNSMDIVHPFETPFVVVCEKTESLDSESSVPSTSRSSTEYNIEVKKKQEQTILGPRFVSGILSLVGPTPYSRARNLMSVPRLTFGKKKSRGGTRQAVRRSQSERSFSDQSKCHSHIQTILTEESYARSIQERTSSDSNAPLVDVKSAVKMIEEQSKGNVFGVTDAHLPGTDPECSHQGTGPQSAECHAEPSTQNSPDKTEFFAQRKHRWISRKNSLYQSI